MYVYVYICVYIQKFFTGSCTHYAQTHSQPHARTPAHTQVCQVAGNMDDASSFDRTKQALHFIGFDQQVCMCV